MVFRRQTHWKARRPLWSMTWKSHPYWRVGYKNASCTQFPFLLLLLSLPWDPSPACTLYSSSGVLLRDSTNESADLGGKPHKLSKLTKLLSLYFYCSHKKLMHWMNIFFVWYFNCVLSQFFLSFIHYDVTVLKKWVLFAWHLLLI